MPGGINHAMSKWMDGSGPEADIVVSSRIRLARNLTAVPFPNRQSKEQADRVIEQVAAAVERFNRDGPMHLTVYRLRDLTPLERRVLVEKHLISPQHLQSADTGAVVVSQDETLSIMINEEDHLRLQVILSGLQLEPAWEAASRLDDALAETLDFAFREDVGYLTACPTNVGTGMRASVMTHLPALAMTNQLPRVVGAIMKLGLVVRGLYGEGTDAIGNMFQISNQITLGQSEEEIIDNLRNLTVKILQEERTAREDLLHDARYQLEDRVSRAYGLLTHARIMSSQEAMQLLSDVRLGVDLELIRPVPIGILNELLVETRPAYLQSMAGEELGPDERDRRRASLIRQRLQNRAGI